MGSARPGARPAGLVGAALVLAGLALLPAVAPGYYVQFATKVLLMGLAATALNLAVGFGGMVSMCHAAFFGLSGYVLALAASPGEAPSLWTTLPLAVGAAVAAALAIGALSLRTRGVYFIMVTLAFGQMLFHLFADTEIAGGSDGAFIYDKPAATLFGTVLLDLENRNVFYGTVLAITATATLLLIRLTASPFGLALAAARDNERRALALGFPVYRVRLAAYAVSGALAGLAGYFSAAQFGFVAPQTLGWHLSAILLVMVVLGGLGSVTGPLVGAAALLGLEEILKAWTESWALVEGVVILAVVLALPGGLRDLARMIAGPDAAGLGRPADRGPAKPAREGGLA